MQESTPVSFSDWIQQRRKLLDLTRAELAQSAGCSVSALRKIETGERRPSKQLASLLSNSLKVPPGYQPVFLRVARGDLNVERLPSPDLFSEEVEGPQSHIPPDFHIPVQRAALVGRESELATLRRLLSDPQCRLMTLTGLGGIGKTRLAVELANTSRSSFPGGIFFTSLAPLQSPDFIIPAIAQVIKLSLSGSLDAREQLLHHLALQRQAFLLVLDNLEHLLVSPSDTERDGKTAMLLSDMLESAPALKILVTSRERIHFQTEWTFELHGLPVPHMPHPGRPEENSAVALFLQNARRLNPEYQMSPQDYSAIVHICQVVGGIPLAIELAAAWTEVLSCEEIAQELQSNLDFLSTFMRDVPDRHRSLRATFDHSWKLLSDEERLVLRRLAVFQGGFQRKAAEQIVQADLRLLANLVSKSLVRRTQAGRYDVHEVIRQFALSHLASDAHEGDVRQAHSDYYLMLLATKESDLKGSAQRKAIQELVDEMDNLRAAWAWAIRQTRFARIGQALRSFGVLCSVHGLLGEGIEQLEMLAQALRAVPQDTEQRAILGMALAQQSLLFFRKGRFDIAMERLEESLALVRSVDDPALLTDPLVIRGMILHLFGEIEQSQSHMEEALAAAQAVGDDWWVAYARFNLGYIDSLTGQYARGYATMLAGLEMWRALGDPSAIALGLSFISPTAIHLGRHAEAETFLQESLLLCTEVGNRWGMGTCYRNLGLAALAQGKVGEARSYVQKSLEVFDGFVTGWDIVRSLIYLGEVAIASGDLSEAQRMFIEAFEKGVEAQSPPLVMEAITGLAHLSMLAGKAARSFDLLRIVFNHHASPAQTKDRARQLLNDLSSPQASGQAGAAQAGSLKDTMEHLMTAILAEA